MNARLLPFVPEFAEVVSKSWVRMDQPELHLELSNGAHVKIQWDLTYGCRNLFVAENKEADFRDATTADTGMHPDDLAGLVDEVYQAVQHDEAERMSGEWDDGREDYREQP